MKFKGDLVVAFIVMAMAVVSCAVNWWCERRRARRDRAEMLRHIQKMGE